MLLLLSVLSLSPLCDADVVRCWLRFEEVLSLLFPAHVLLLLSSSSSLFLSSKKFTSHSFRFLVTGEGDGALLRPCSVIERFKLFCFDAKGVVVVVFEVFMLVVMLCSVLL